MKLASLGSLALACALGQASCGTLSSNADEPGRLVTVAGTITNPSSLAVDNGSFRVAVVWDTSGQAVGDGGFAADRRITQDTAVTPIFPASFRLDLTELPPELQPFQQLFGAPPSVDLRGVAGFVVAYEDKNHDSKLDLVTAGSPGFLDSVLGEGSAPILYLEGTMPSDLSLLANAKDTDGHLPALGFNLFETYCVSGKDPGASRRCEDSFDWMPVSTQIAIALSADPRLSSLMCEELSSDGKMEQFQEHPPGEWPTPFPPATDPNVSCAPGGYAACATTTPPGICQAAITSCNSDTYVLAVGAAAPSGWPCIVH